MIKTEIPRHIHIYKHVYLAQSLVLFISQFRLSALTAKRKKCLTLVPETVQVCCSACIKINKHRDGRDKSPQTRIAGIIVNSQDAHTLHQQDKSKFLLRIQLVNLIFRQCPFLS